jgi:hypothetical protein
MGCGCPAHPFPPLKLLQDSCHTSVLQGSTAVRHCPAAGLRIILPLKSAAGQLSCSCPVEPFSLVDVLKDSCPRCVLQVSFKQDSPATVGHAATRTRRRAAGQWAIHTMRSDGKQTEKENRDGSHDQTQATEHARPIRRTSPTSGVTSRCHGTNSHNSKNKNTHKNNCVCVCVCCVYCFRQGLPFENISLEDLHDDLPTHAFCGPPRRQATSCFPSCPMTKGTKGFHLRTFLL